MVGIYTLSDEDDRVRAMPRREIVCGPRNGNWWLSQHCVQTPLHLWLEMTEGQREIKRES